MSYYWATWIWDFPHIAVGLSEFVLGFCVTWRLTHPRPPARHESRMVTGEDGRDYRVTDTPTIVWRNDKMGYQQVCWDNKRVRIADDWRQTMKRKDVRYLDRWQVTDD